MSRKKSEEFQSRWGDSELDDKGYLYIPGWIMRHYHKVKNKDGETVGLTPNEFTFLSHVMCFKYDVPSAQAKPSLETIAKLIGRHVSNIRKWKQSLEDKGLLKVTYVDGMPSIYDFAELVKQCRQFESEITTPSEITRGSKIAKTTPSEITSPPLAKSLGEDIEIKAEPKKQKLKDSPAAKPTRKTEQGNTRPAIEFNPLKDAIVLAFGWSWKTMTRSEVGKVQATARDLYDAGIRAFDIPSLHKYCSKHRTNFGPNALCGIVSEWRKTAPPPKVAPKGSPAQPPPTKPDAPDEIPRIPTMQEWDAMERARRAKAAGEGN